MFLLLAIVLFIFLPSPWNAFAGFASIVLFILEASYWQRRVRSQKTQTGVERLVGATGEVSERLAPIGQIRVLGELWQARSASDLPPGSRVRVTAVDGLILEVEPVDEDAMNGRPPH
jgi:membrane protein implicated in regulation of membrane protease activity